MTPTNIAAANTMRTTSKVEVRRTYRLQPAPSLTANFDKHLRTIFDSGDKTPDTINGTPGLHALTSQNKFLLPRSSKRSYGNIQDNPLKLEMDDTPCPKVCKHEQKLSKQPNLIATTLWSDRLCTELNYCEWAQIASVKILNNISEEMATHPELKQTFEDLSLCIDLLGENLNKAEVSASAIKSNVVLEQRDKFIVDLNKDVPTNLSNIARVQPIFQHPKLIGEPVELMAKALEVTQTQLANKAMAQVARLYTNVIPRGKGSSSTSRRGHHQARGRGVHNNSYNVQNQTDSGYTGRDNQRGRSYSSRPRGNRGHRGGRGYRGGRGQSDTNKDSNKA